MPLTLMRTETFSLSYTAQRGLLVMGGSLSDSDTFKLSDGTAAGQADSPFTALMTLPGGSVDAFNLAAGLTDAYGNQLDFTAVKVLRIITDLGNAEDLIVGGGTWAGMFGDASNTLRLRPGARNIWEASDANGWPVDPAADQLLIASAGDAIYKITIVGVSSKVSKPAWALHPAIIGTPRVGTPATCTVGDVSGSPAFRHQWVLAGVKIPGAQDPTYTPLAGQAGKMLARTTTATNDAGSAAVTTAQVPVQVAGGAVGDLSLDNPGLGVSAVL